MQLPRQTSKMNLRTKPRDFHEKLRAVVSGRTDGSVIITEHSLSSRNLKKRRRFWINNRAACQTFTDIGFVSQRAILEGAAVSHTINEYNHLLQYLLLKTSVKVYKSKVWKYHLRKQITRGHSYLWRLIQNFYYFKS